MRQFYTYLHCKPDGTPFYVGKGCDTHIKRSHDFRRGRNQHHKNIIAKHGAENILVYIFPCDSEEQAFADEIQQIAQLRREGYDLANIFNGGEGATGLIHSEETKRKIREARKKQIFSPEARAKISASLIGNKRTLGMKASPETRAKLSANSNSRRPEARAKMSAARMGNKYNLGKTASPEHRAKISASLIGNKRTSGHKLTKEHKAKISANNGKGGRLNKGRKASSVTRAKMSESAIAAWAKRRV